ncbi:hypothetical protein KY285_025671, partial [Solanum tuberosum]
EDFYSNNSKMVSWGGGVIEFGPPPKYIGGNVTEFLDVDVDMMSYFELRDYIKELGYTIDCEFFIKWDGLLVLVDNDKVVFDLFNMINDGDTVEVYVFHGVSEANQAPLELEFLRNVSDSGVGEESFNKASNPNNQPPTFTFPSIPTTGPSETSSTLFEDQSTTVPPPSPSSNVPPPSPSIVPPSSTVPPPSPSIVPPPSTVPFFPLCLLFPLCLHPLLLLCLLLPLYLHLILSDDEVENESRSEGDTNKDIKVDSDVHQEYIDIGVTKRHFKRSQRRSRDTTSDHIKFDEKGPDIGYDETNIGIRERLVGKLGGDEPYYLSDEAPSSEIDDETGWGDGEEADQVVHKHVRRKKTPYRVVFDATSEKIVWELGLVFGTVKEFRVAVPRYAVQEHIQIEKYVNEPSRVRVRCCK